MYVSERHTREASWGRWLYAVTLSPPPSFSTATITTTTTTTTTITATTIATSMSDADIMAEAYSGGGGHDKGEAPPRSLSPGSKPPTPVGPRRMSGIMDLSTTGPETHGTENGLQSSPYPSLMGLSGAGLSNGGGSSAGSKLACRYCGKTFSQAGYIKAHERLHTGEKPFACSVCGKRFSDPSNWKKHERVHANQTRKSGPPPPPDMAHKVKHLFLRSVTSLVSSSLHQRLSGGRVGGESGGTGSSVVCKVCFKVFSSQSSLSTHKRIHTGERPYRCGRCGKAFTQVGTLRTHERVHTGEKPYVCRVCGRTFAQSGSYRMHERRHATDTTQRCHVCYATFSSWKELQLHMSSHPQVSKRALLCMLAFQPLCCSALRILSIHSCRSSSVHNWLN